MSGPILLVSEIFPPRHGGSGRWLWELYRRFRSQVVVAAGGTEGDADFDRTADMAITRMPLSLANWGLLHPRGGPQYLRAFGRLNAVAKVARPRALHCGKCLPEGLLADLIQRWRGIPYICYAHGEELTLAATSRELHALTRHVLSRATAVVANSWHTKDLLKGPWGVPEDKIIVLHPGVDTSRFVPAARNEEARGRLGWAGRTVVLTVGALQARKGQDMLIRALPFIRRTHPEILYAIGGEGWERPRLEALVAELGLGDLVQFRGTPTDEELVSCYQQCDLFALPNRQVGWNFEGFGIVLLEAQACGKAVIAGQSGGTAEAIDSGRTGILADCRTPEPLAQAIIDMLTNPGRVEMGLRGRQWVVERFDYDVLSRRALESFAAFETRS